MFISSYWPDKQTDRQTERHVQLKESPLDYTTDLYKYSPDAVPPIHAVSYHVRTDKPPAQNGDKIQSICSDNRNSQKESTWHAIGR